MRVHIISDMEGVAGVNHPAPTARADSRYPDAVGLMVGEANAAIRGAFDGGAAEVGIATLILPPAPATAEIRGLDVVTRMVGAG